MVYGEKVLHAKKIALVEILSPLFHYIDDSICRVDSTHTHTHLHPSSLLNCNGVAKKYTAAVFAHTACKKMCTLVDSTRFFCFLCEYIHSSSSSSRNTGRVHCKKNYNRLSISLETILRAYICGILYMEL